MKKNLNIIRKEIKKNTEIILFSGLNFSFGGSKENKCFNETVNTWKADHIYRHSANAIIAFLLLLFIAVNIFNIFHVRNIKDKAIKTMAFLINKINAEFLSLKRPLPLIPIPISPSTFLKVFKRLPLTTFLILSQVTMF